MEELRKKTILRWKDNILIGYNKMGRGAWNGLNWLRIDGSCKQENERAGSVKQRLSKCAGKHKN
jgi:hypothetical protein